jgi:hypothetical protein
VDVVIVIIGIVFGIGGHVVFVAASAAAAFVCDCGVLVKLFLLGLMAVV